jgi:hypothetical protein
MKTNSLITTNNGTHNGKLIDVREQLSRETVKERSDENHGYDKLTPTEVYLRSSAYEDGYQLGVKSNDFRPNPETEEKLRYKWEKVAKESDQGIFDAENNLHDKHYHEEFERLQNIRQDAEDALHHAEINLRQKEEALAQTLKPEEENNTFFWLLFVVAVTVFSIGFAPTFHDIFFITIAQTDPLVGWLLSILVSIPIGAILALLILVEFGKKITTFNWLGLAAGILVALGFLFIRLSASDNLDSLSVGLTLYEVALVLGLEACAYFRRKEKKEAQVAREIYEKSQNDADIALKQKDRSLEAYEDTSKAIKTHIEYIEQRNIGTLFNSAIEEALVAAAVNGYHAGIKDNHGRKIGRKDK